MHYVPSEFTLGGVYFSPLLIASFLGVLAASMTVMLLNRYRLSRFFYYPPMIYLGLVGIYTGLIGTFLIPVYRNPDNLHQIIDEVAERRGVTGYPINTGLVEDGDDLGAGDGFVAGAVLGGRLAHELGLEALDGPGLVHVQG